MKKRAILIVLIFLICCIPVRFGITDGGSYGYQALLYRITVWDGGLSEEEKTTGITIDLFGFIEIYDSFRLVSESGV